MTYFQPEKMLPSEPSVSEARHTVLLQQRINEGLFSSSSQLPLHLRTGLSLKPSQRETHRYTVVTLDALSLLMHRDATCEPKDALTALELPLALFIPRHEKLFTIKKCMQV